MAGFSSLGFPVLYIGQGYLFEMGIVDLIYLPWDTLSSAITSTVAAVYDNLYEKVSKVVPVITGILQMVICDALYQRLFRGQEIKTEIQSRSEEEKVERRNAVLAAEYVLKKTGRFKLKYPDDPAMDWGSRMQKYWMLVKPTVTVELDDQRPSPVLTIAPISRHCPLLEDDEQRRERTLKKETVNTVSELIGILQLHPYIHPLTSMDDGQPVMVYYLSDRKQVIMVQENTRSLKDVIYKVEFTEKGKDWAEKYLIPKPKGTPWSHYLYKFVRLVTGVSLLSFLFAYCLSNARRVIPSRAWYLLVTVPGTLVGMFFLLCGRRTKQPPAIPLDNVALYGQQILEAIVFLYNQGFPVLGHVHSGNIFVQDGVCRLGGCENTLLGYRNRFYRMCKHHLEHMDVIMFGHLVFEMCCGYELTTVVPTAQDYEAVRDVEGGEEVEEVLRYIFTDGFPHGIKHILVLPFFQSVMLPHFDENKIQLNREMASLLVRVGGADQEEEHEIEQPSDRLASRRRRMKCRVS